MKRKSTEPKQDPDYINFGDYARKELNQQCQYASHYITGVAGYENLGKGLRLKKIDTGDYHDIMIHKDDAKIFKDRYHKYRKEIGCE
jgi:hypothetical protein